jgi:hypothetical protein
MGAKLQRIEPPDATSRGRASSSRWRSADESQPDPGLPMATRPSSAGVEPDRTWSPRRRVRHARRGGPAGPAMRPAGIPGFPGRRGGIERVTVAERASVVADFDPPGERAKRRHALHRLALLEGADAVAMSPGRPLVVSRVRRLSSPDIFIVWKRLSDLWMLGRRRGLAARSNPSIERSICLSCWGRRAVR